MYPYSLQVIGIVVLFGVMHNHGKLLILLTYSIPVLSSLSLSLTALTLATNVMLGDGYSG